MKQLASSILLSILYTGVYFVGNTVSNYTDALDTQLISLNLECEGEHVFENFEICKKFVKEKYANITG